MCRNAAMSFGLNEMNPGGTESCTARRTRSGCGVGELHRGDRAHVVADDVCAFDPESLEDGEQVVHSRFTLEAGLLGFGPAGTAQVGADHAVAMLGDPGCDLVPLPPVQRETVQQHDGFTVADGGDVRAQSPACRRGGDRAGRIGQRADRHHRQPHDGEPGRLVLVLRIEGERRVSRNAGAGSGVARQTGRTAVPSGPCWSVVGVGGDHLQVGVQGDVDRAAVPGEHRDVVRRGRVAVRFEFHDLAVHLAEGGGHQCRRSCRRRGRPPVPRHRPRRLPWR